MIDYVDLVSRLRNWTILPNASPASDLMDEAAAGIEALVANRNHWMGAARAFDEHLAAMRVMLMEQPGVRFGAAESRETVQCPYVVGGTTKYCTLTTFTLTDEERESISYYLGTGGPYAVHATLSGLLSRTGSNSRQTGDDATECHSQSGKTPERESLAQWERAAIAEASDFYVGTRTGVALRKLLERLGGGK